jgi:hypothetical protein
MSVQPHVEVWDSYQLTNLLRIIHELPSLGFPFGIHIENVLKRDGGKGAYIHGHGRGCLRWIPLTSQSRLTTNSSALENGHLSMADLDLLAWLME